MTRQALQPPLGCILRLPPSLSEDSRPLCVFVVSTQWVLQMESTHMFGRSLRDSIHDGWTKLWEQFFKKKRTWEGCLNCDVRRCHSSTHLVDPWVKSVCSYDRLLWENLKVPYRACFQVHTFNSGVFWRMFPRVRVQNSIVLSALLQHLYSALRWHG